MDPIWLLAATTGALGALGLREARRHRANLAKIPTRIHVNGTRGKSSVTRLIAAGLREGGVTTCAKTTGTLPRMILPDGREFPVYRPSRPNVIEQVRIVATAADVGAQALVIECMALQPALQWLSEEKLVKATHAVITNVRADHLEVMGPTEEDVAKALGGMIPRGGVLFTAERRRLPLFAAMAKDRGCQLVAVTDADVEAVTASEMERFTHVEHAENVALALAVCESLGTPRATALRGMWKAKPDPGGLTIHELDFFGRRIVFANGFAANDPESTEQVWRMALARFPEVEKRIAVFNCRADRPERTFQLAAACARWPWADHYILVGGGAYLFARRAGEAGLDEMRMILADHRRADEVFEMIVDMSEGSALVMGLGNIGGPGLDLARYFRNRAIRRPRSLAKETG